MRTNLLRHVAVALGLCIVSTQAFGDDYKAPSKWSSFNNQKTQGLYRTVGDKLGQAQSVIQSASDAASGAAHSITQSTPVLQSQSRMAAPGQPGCPPCANGGGLNGAGGNAYGGNAYGGNAYGGAVGTTYGGQMGMTQGGAMGMTQGGAMGTTYGGQTGMTYGGQAGVSQGSIVDGTPNVGTYQGTQGTIGGAIGGNYNQGNILSDRVIAESAPRTVQTTIQPAPMTYSQAPAIYSQAPAVYSQAPAVSYNSSGYSGYGSIGQAVSRGGGYGPISPYFGGANLLFLSLNDNNGSRNLITEDATGNTQLSVGSLDPTDTVGFDVHFGRYLAGGCYGLDFGFFNFNPGRVETIVTPAVAGAYRASIQAFRTATVPIGNAYDLYNDAPEAVGYRGRRDLRFTGFELNLFSFGRMGAKRMGASCNSGLGRGLGAGHKLGLNSRGRYGGAGGGLSRGGNRVQIQTSHGFRYFQLEDEFELAGNIDGFDGYQLDDIYYNIDVDNTLMGYQFGSQLSYCLTPRLLGIVGGKAGIYGNQVDYRQQLGTGNDLAYLTVAGVDDISTHESDTVLSFLGELNLGLGYRLSNAWTVTGGYKMLAACGVATAPGAIATDFTSVVAGNDLRADDCLILHGGYVGLEYNW